MTETPDPFVQATEATFVSEYQRGYRDGRAAVSDRQIHSVDRDALIDLLRSWDSTTPREFLADRILALLHAEPCDEANQEDIDRVIAGLQIAATVMPNRQPWDALAERLGALADRIEADRG